MERNQFWVFIVAIVAFGLAIEAILKTDADPTSSRAATQIWSKEDYEPDTRPTSSVYRRIIGASPRFARKLIAGAEKIAGLDGSTDTAAAGGDTAKAGANAKKDDKKTEKDAKKDDKKKDDKKKKKKKKKVDGKDENKGSEPNSDEADDTEEDKSAEAAAPAPADAGFTGGVVAAEPSAYPLSLKEWQDYLLGTPDYKRTTEFIRLYQTGIVEPEIFYTIVDQMLDDTRYRMREFGVMSLGATPSVRSFTVLVDVHNAETTAIKDYAARHIRAYSQLQFLRILASALSADNATPTLSLEALRLLQQASQRYLKNLNTGQPTEQGNNDDRGPAATSMVVRHFDPFLPVLLQMSQSASNSDIRHYATQALSELQALLQPHTT